MLYSKSNNGFFDSSINGDNVPVDAVEISAETYADLLASQSLGKIISSGADGLPVSLDPPPPSVEMLLLAATRKREDFFSLASNQIAPLQDAVDLDDATESEISQLKKWKQFRVALNRLELSASIIDWPTVP